jgi:hypothetical protein
MGAMAFTVRIPGEDLPRILYETARELQNRGQLQNFNRVDFNKTVDLWVLSFRNVPKNGRKFKDVTDRDAQELSLPQA